LDETYNRILARIPLEYKQNAIRILQFLVFSERPLRIEEAVDAIAVCTERDPWFDPRDRMPEPKEISRYCSALVVVVPRKVNQYNQDKIVMELELAHFSVKEYLKSNRLEKGFTHCFQEIAAKASIATVCLAYLLLLDWDLLLQDIEEAFPLAHYCARYWMSHAAVAEGNDKMLQGLIMKFFLSYPNAYETCYWLHRPDMWWRDTLHYGDGKPAAALYYASFGGLTNAVMCLIDRGANVNAEGGYYGNPLYAASVQGHEKIVELLLSKGADINGQIENYGSTSTALQAASLKGHEKVVELLLSKGADVNAQGGSEGSAL
jgi:ankyrin repeat protein